MVPSIAARWVRRLFTHRAPPPPPRPSFRPTLEQLEDRLTPSVTFANQQTFATGGQPSGSAVADFNNDGRPDLVVANFNDNTISVLLNTTAPGASAASFAAQVTFAIGSGTGPDAVAVGDFNGDGRPDIAVANRTSGSVYVLLNTTAAGATAPSFAPAVLVALENSPYSLAAGDFNGDGRPDLAVANYNGTVNVILNTTARGTTVPSFSSGVIYNVGSQPQSVAVGDFNEDGKPDIVVANSGANTISVLQNQTAAGATVPSFAAQQTFNVGALPSSVTVADFNGDGRPDIAVANYNDGQVGVLLNNTTAQATSFTFAPQQTYQVGAFPISVTTGDFNGDGRPDLAVANYNGGVVSVLQNQTVAGATAPSFAAQQLFTVLDNGDNTVAAGDFNGDGRPDLAVTSAGDAVVAVLLNTTTPFAATVPTVVADVHGQGVVGYNRLTGQWVQLNPGNPADVTLLAVDALGDVFADYKGYGVFRYRPSVGVWQMVNGTDAVAMAVDAKGDAFLSFAGAGVGLFRPDGSAALLTPSTASTLAADAQGDLAMDFTGYGVYHYRAFGGTFVLLNGTDTSQLGIDAAGDVFASFAGAGVAEFRADGSSQLLSGTAASRLAVDALGDLTAYAPGKGVEQYRPSVGLRVLVPDISSVTGVAMDSVGDGYADFPGYGVDEYDPFQGWHQIGAADVTLLTAAAF